jgi:hypothetical protein
MFCHSRFVKVLLGVLFTGLVSSALSAEAPAPSRAVRTQHLEQVRSFLDRQGALTSVDKERGQAALSRITFLALDVNADGALSRDEFLSGFKEKTLSKSPLEEDFRERLLEELQRQLGKSASPEVLGEAFKKAEQSAARVRDFEKEFDALAKGEKALTFERFDAARQPQRSPAPGVASVLDAAHTAFTLKYLKIAGPQGAYPANRDQFDYALAKLMDAERTAAEADAPRPIPGYHPGIGYVLRGDAAEFKTNPWSDSLVLRIAGSGKSLLSSSLIPRITGTEKTEKAELAISKSEGENSQVTVDGAIRLEWRNARLLRDADRKVLPFAAFEVQRRGSGDKTVDLRRYYLQAFYYQHHGNNNAVLEASAFYGGPIYETDLKNDVNTVIMAVDWEPLLNLGPLRTGRWNPLLGLPGVQYAITPRLGFQHRNVVDKPQTSDAEDSFYGSAKAKVELAILDGGLKLGYSYQHLRSFRASAPSAIYREWTASVPLSRDDTLSLVGSYKSGEATPGAPSTHTYQIGLGVAY